MKKGIISVWMQWPKGHLKLTDVIMEISDLKKLAVKIIDYKPESHQPISQHLRYKRNLPL